MADNKFYGAVGTTGGSDGDIDKLDGTSLIEADGICLISSSRQGALYSIDITSALTEKVPSTIIPDTGHGGVKAWILTELLTAGLSVYEADSTNLFTISQSSGDVLFDNTFDTGIITLQGEDTGNKTLMTLDPAGSVDLYFANSKKLETTTTGATITGVLISDGLTLGDDEDITFGAGPDAKISSNGTSLVIQNGAGTETMILAKQGDLVTLYCNNVAQLHTVSAGIQLGQATSYIKSSSGGNALLIAAGGATALYHNNNKKFETSATGATLTGILVADGLTMGDNEDITLGAGPDAKLSSDGTAFVIENGAGNATMLKATQTAGVVLYYNTGTKFQTTNTGVTVNGTIISDGLAMSDNDDITLGNGPDAKISSNGTALTIENGAGTETLLTATQNGAVALYYDNTLRASTLDDGFEIAAGGSLTLPEITTPTADANKGKLYTKADNKLYFQDGAGAEHEVRWA